MPPLSSLPSDLTQLFSHCRMLLPVVLLSFTSISFIYEAFHDPFIKVHLVDNESPWPVYLTVTVHDSPGPWETCTVRYTGSTSECNKSSLDLGFKVPTASFPTVQRILTHPLIDLKQLLGSFRHHCRGIQMTTHTHTPTNSRTHGQTHEPMHNLDQH